jgi:HK97 family phage prohead protease
MDRAARAALLKGREVRRAVVPSHRVEVRSADSTLTFTGVASSTSQRVGSLGSSDSALTRDNGYDMGWYTERIMIGAFANTLNRSPDVQLLVNHEGLPLARTTNGTLDLREDADQGLVFEARVDSADPDAQTLARKVESGLMDQCSFAFRVLRQNWSDDHDVREITEVDLNRGDVSVVNYGANPKTSAAVRSLIHDLAILDDEERAEMRAAETLAATFTELRAGAALSAGTTATLKHLLSLCSASDAAMDTAQQVLADLLGVTNPDIAQDAAMQSNGFSLDFARAQAFALRASSSMPRRSA